MALSRWVEGELLAAEGLEDLWPRTAGATEGRENQVSLKGKRNLTAMLFNRP
ncbi:MAG: hypothetical protein QXT73_07525 [Candidatus Methanomethylicaceae archaeon]